MKRTLLWAVGCVVGLCSLLSVGLAGEALAPPPAKPPAPPESEFEKQIQEIKNPVKWFSWGADYRLRQEYLKDIFDFNHGTKDNRNVIRNRLRLWTKFGPFFTDDAIEAPNGLSLYTRFLYGPRYYTEFQTAGAKPPWPDWNETIVDNLYADWQRIGGLPISLRLGRQDLMYGRGFVIMDGTPLDGSRTSYNDGLKGTIHLDDWKSTLDILALKNKGSEEQRLRPLDWQQKAVAEQDADIFGTYLTSKYFKDTEIGAYYIYKHEDTLRTYGYPDRVVNTLGAMVQGKCMTNWDYYAELAGQWGKEGDRHRRGLGFSSDLGYTFPDCSWTPRLHSGYEFLSGDDPETRRFEGWDPVLGRWPRWSELFGYRLARETGRPYFLTNLQRPFIGASVKPIKKLTVSLDYSYLLIDEHDMGTTGIYSDGCGRGQLLLGQVGYDISKHVTTRLWAEYFKPGSYYSADDSAVFLQWQVIFTF